MTKLLQTDPITGSEYIVEHSIPVPNYDIGYTVEYKNAKDEVVSGIITGYSLSVSDHTDSPTLFVQTMYTIDNGRDEIMEEDVLTYTE